MSLQAIVCNAQTMSLVIPDAKMISIRNSNQKIKAKREIGSLHPLLQTAHGPGFGVSSSHSLGFFWRADNNLSRSGLPRLARAWGGGAHRLLRQDQICFAWQGQTLVPFCQDSVSCSTYQWCVIAAEGLSYCRGMLLSLMRVVSLLSDTEDTGEMP